MVESFELAQRSESRWEDAESGSDSEGFMAYRGRRHHGQARVYREAVSTQHDEAGPSMRSMPVSQEVQDDGDLHPEAWAGRSYNDGGRGISRKARIVLAAGFLTLCYTLFLMRRSSYSETGQIVTFTQPVQMSKPSSAPKDPEPLVPLPEWLHSEPVVLQPPRGKLEAVRDITMHAPLLKDDCLEAWVARGEICSGLTWSASQSSEPAMVEARRLGRSHDVVFTAVNGSDPRHTAARILYGRRPYGSWFDWRAKANNGQLLRRDSKFTHTAKDSGILGDVVNRYRDNGELRYAVRSAWTHLKALNKIHIFTPDYAAPLREQPEAISASVVLQGSLDASHGTALASLPSELDAGVPTDRFVAEEGVMRRGQLPAWLNISSPLVAIGNAAERLHHTASKLFVRHDWNLAYPAAMERGSVPEDALLAWKREVLPSFNSMALEGMLGGHPGLSEQMLYANDDFFVVKDHSLADVSTPLLGPVLRFQVDLGVPGVENPGPELEGEWRALMYCSWLLDERFGKRTRPYVPHVHRSLLTPILAEIRLIWREQLDALASKRFRGLGREANMAMHFLHHHCLIELHREALLWSFFVLRLDRDGDGVFRRTEWEQALTEMGVVQPFSVEEDTSNLQVAVRFPERTSLAKTRLEHDLGVTGLGMPNHTKLEFTSQDGFPFAALSIFFQLKPSSAVPRQRGRTAQAGALSELFPNFVPGNDTQNSWRFRESERAPCVLDIAHCAMKGKSVIGLRPEEMFRQFAVEDPRCGDCLILHLIRHSGKAGVSAFLPEPGRTFAKSTSPHRSKKSPPHLPIVQRVRPLTAKATATVRFSAKSVAEESGWQGESMRTFAMRMIQRYAYVVGSSSISFRRLETYSQAVHMLKELKDEDLEYALLCLNDDLQSNALDLEIGAFGEAKWPLPAPFELS